MGALGDDVCVRFIFARGKIVNNKEDFKMNKTLNYQNLSLYDCIMQSANKSKSLGMPDVTLDEVFHLVKYAIHNARWNNANEVFQKAISSLYEQNSASDNCGDVNIQIMNKINEEIKIWQRMLYCRDIMLYENDKFLKAFIRQNSSDYGFEEFEEYENAKCIYEDVGIKIYENPLDLEAYYDNVKATMPKVVYNKYLQYRIDSLSDARGTVIKGNSNNDALKVARSYGCGYTATDNKGNIITVPGHATKGCYYEIEIDDNAEWTEMFRKRGLCKKSTAYFDTPLMKIIRVLSDERKNAVPLKERSKAVIVIKNPTHNSASKLLQFVKGIIDYDELYLPGEAYHGLKNIQFIYAMDSEESRKTILPNSLADSAIRL